MAHDHSEQPPNDLVRDLMREANRRHVPVIIGADANAHHSVWGSSDTNSRVKDIKKKWRNIRDAYRKYKQKENLPSGSEAAFIRPYKYSESLRFLDDVPHIRLTTTNISDDSIETLDLSSDDFCAPPKKKKMNLE
ncbi:uncharacterized protein LOC119599983 [Lucilia sericata]|uniref:uncharacterized protein LOC119599983 n=1 Tax=Lucilia sericata TaxID=13632 RepID=UPI0018A8772D|nr:uncharacterized protein LOC119599983 [Lucilia sericata]